MTSRERCGGQGDGTAGKAGADRNGDEWEAATLELGPAHTDDVYVVSFKASYALGGKGASDSEMQMYIAEILVRARLRGSEVQTGKAKEEEMHANSKNGVTTCTDSTTATTPCGKEALDHDVADKTFYKGRGCDQCNNTGYRGRTGLFEFLKMTERLKDMVINNASTDELREVARTEGMISLRDAGYEAIFDGRTTVEEIVRETAAD